MAISSQALARQQAVGPGVIPLNATGMLSGVDMSASGTTGTLGVGVPGGPETDILSSNNPYVPGMLAVTTAVSSQGNIVFNSSSTVFGGIGVTQPGGPFLLNVSGGNTGATVNLLGPLYATTLNVTGTGAVNFNSGSTNITATNFAADGTISLAPNTTVIGALTTTAGADTGTLLLGGGSVLNGAVGGAVGLRSISVQGGSAIAGVTATITGAVSAYSLSLGTNTLNIGGALTIANLGPAGVINTTLASPSVYGNIRPVGATNLGATLQVNVTVPSSAVIPVGTQFNIIQTQPGTQQSGTDGSVVAVTVKDPTNPLYSFQATPTAGTLAGEVTIRTTSVPLLVPLAPPVGVVLPPTLPVAVVVAPVLVALTPTVAPVVVVAPTPTPTPTPTPAPSAPSNPDLASVIAPINALTDAAAVVQAVSQLAPSTASEAAPLVAFQAARQFQNLWQSHLETVLCNESARPQTDTQACAGNVEASNWWLKGFVYSGRQDARQSFAAYDTTILGTMMGYDFPIAPDTRVGLSIGFADSSIDESGVANKTDFQTYQATAYIGHRSGPWFINGDASIGLNDYTGNRQIVFPGVDRTARAKYSGQTYGVSAYTGYDIPVDQFTVTPLASLQYTNIRTDGFQETGAGAIDLRIASQNDSFLESGLGAKVARDFNVPYGVLKPEVHAKWLHELSNPTLSQTAAFTAAGSPSFTSPGLKTSADTLNAGASLTLYSCTCGPQSWSIEAGYDYFGRSDGYAAHQGMIKITSRF
ncbi:MAG: hypothetical protein JWO51_2890 [Rhodospirillales bacterium]|nr:hypothetical protein [Rhodospirillales bacterium]